MLEKFYKKIDEIIAKMSLKEKIGQLNQLETPTPETLDAFREAVKRGEVGSVLMSVGATAGNDPQGAIDVDFYNEMQRIAVEETPSGIPMIFGRDVIHGHRTVFPIPLAMTASFNPELIRGAYRDVAEEAANESVHWTFTPMLDMCHDPRWGRIIEGTGEDPYLGARFAEAIVDGLQDGSDGGKTMLSCAKHFIGYGASEGGRDYHRTEISDYSLYNYYLPAFRSAIKAGAVTVMSSFNDVNGQPVTSSEFYLTELLRNKLGFEGLVVSDYDAVWQTVKQGVAEGDADAARLAIQAGVDIDMHAECYTKELERLVLCGKVPMEVVDRAVRRVLAVKFAAGLFENPYCKPEEYNRDEHLDNALKVAEECMVLLKNEGGVLPISRSCNVALVGPYAHNRRSLLGSWTIDGKEEETENLEEAFSRYFKGSVKASPNHELTAELVGDADVIVLALGEEWNTTGENKAVSDISIKREQKELIKRAKATGKKVVGVFFCGRPIAMQGVAELLDAVIYAWHSGSKAAQALTRILLGDCVPSGRLPVTMPRLATHIPLYYNVTSSGRPVNCYYGERPEACYVDSVATPYYPFGYGLSYTSFEYGEIECENPELSLADLKSGKSFKLSLNVKNTGRFDGKETVQLYIHDKVASMMRPLRELKSFKKVFIKKGEEVEVSFSIGYDELGFYNVRGEYVIESGEVDVYIGENCLTDRKTTLILK